MIWVEGKVDKYRLSKMIFLLYNSHAGDRISKLSPIFVIQRVSLIGPKCLRTKRLGAMEQESQIRDILRTDTKNATCLGAKLVALR